MSKPSFTPGPWSVSECASQIVAGNRMIAGVTGASKQPIKRENHLIAEANARLIAAAPEMLRALKITRDYLDSPPLRAIGTEEAARLLDDIIARAEGGE